MKSIIICEGNTDLTLIQYFLEKVYNWNYVVNNKQNKNGIIHPVPAASYKWFNDDKENYLCIAASGGVSKITALAEKIVNDINKLGALKPFDRFVVISDRDELDTEKAFIDDIKSKFSGVGVSFEDEVKHNNWNNANYFTEIEEKRIFSFLPLIIPFEETGALETFLLNALSEESRKNDPQKIDEYVVCQCIHFIDSLDCKGKYLSHRRERTKAKFDTVFAVMTPAEAFHQRRDILRSIPWEMYESVQDCFKQLGKLTELGL